MSIKNAIIHHLSKKEGKAEAIIQYGEKEQNVEGKIVSLFEQYKQSLQRSAQRQYGAFDPEKGDNPYPGLLKNLQSSSLSFESFTRKLMDHLKVQLDSSMIHFNSHIIFVLENLVDSDFLYVFWINHSDAYRIDNRLELETIQFIDTAKLSFAMKLNFDQWAVENWQQYLAILTSRGNKDMTELFTEHLGFISHVNIKEQTEEFLSIVDAYADTLPMEHVSPYKNKVVEYCVSQDMQGEPVDIQSLSTELSDESPEDFAQFVSEKQQNKKNEIYTERAQLKKFVRLFGRDKNLSISFSSEMVGAEIIYDESEDQLIVKHIPKSLKAQIVRHMKKQS